MANLNAQQQAQDLFTKIRQGAGNLIKPVQQAVSTVQTFNRGVNTPSNYLGQSRPNLPPPSQPINLKPIVGKVMNTQIPITNLIPGGQILNNFSPKVTSQQLQTQARQIIPSIWQEPAKFGAGLALSARNAVTGTNNSFYQPDNLIAKSLLGNNPVRDIQGQGQVLSNTLQKYGVQPQIANNIGVPGVVALGALNVLPGGGSKSKGVQEAIRLAKGSKTAEEFAVGFEKLAPESKRAIVNILKDSRSPINTLRDFWNKVNGEIPDIKPNLQGDEGLKFRNGLLASKKQDFSNVSYKVNDILDNLKEQGKKVKTAVSNQEGFARLDLGLTGGKTERIKLKGRQDVSSNNIIPQLTQAGLNIKNYNIPNQGKDLINKTISEVKPQIEKNIGVRLSNNEVINFANKTSKVLNKAVGRDQTLEFNSALLKARQNLAAASKSGTVDQDYIDNLLAVKTQATDIARKLQSFSIGADPLTTTAKEKILEAVLKVNNDTEAILKAAQGVDFNDANQAVNFYRQFVKPTKTDWLDLIRYNSMLSSPLTHIVNTTSNLINSGLVAPVEKTLTGTIDFLNPIRRVQGKPQTQFASEGARYTAGYINQVGQAAHKFADVVRGKAFTGNLDINQIPIATQGKAGRQVAVLSIPTKLLEASDQFFTTLTKGGETAALKYRQSKGVNVGNIETQAANNAAYRLFRSELHREGQGKLLEGIDHLTSVVQSARTKPGWAGMLARFTIPFLRTPMNIIKQGVEYSPAGFATLPGAANKTEQLSKAILGTAGAAMAGMMIASGRTTWAEPTDPNGRAAFRAAGLQPYSVKVGDKWVSFQKLNPALSFPLAFMAAIHDAESKKTIDQSQVDAILSAVAKFGNFYSDQSYLKNIGDLVAASKGNVENITQFVGNYPQQLVPFRALLGWMARLTDPVQRKVNTDAGYLTQQVQNLLINIPMADRLVPARLDQYGQPIPNQNATINAFSPLRVTTERPAQKQIYDLKQNQALFNKNVKAAKSMIQQGKNVNFGDIASAAEKNNFNPQDELRKKAELDIAREKVKFTGKIAEVNGNIIYPDGKGGTSIIDVSTPLVRPKATGQPQLDKQRLTQFANSYTYKINDVSKLVELGKLSPQEGESLVKALQDKQKQIRDEIKGKTTVQNKLTGNSTIDKYVVSRIKSDQTTQINKVIDQVQAGTLTTQEGEQLINTIKKQNANRIGTGKKAKKIRYKVAKVPKIKQTKIKPIKAAIKIKLPKYKSVKYKKVGLTKKK